MKKRTVIIIAIAILSFLASAVLIFISSSKKTQQKTTEATESVKSIIRIEDIKNILEGTGGAIVEPSEEDTQEGISINLLQKELPLSTNEFTVTTYNYSKAKFVVVFNIETESKKDEIFLNWLQNSDYSPISIERFKVE